MDRRELLGVAGAASAGLLAGVAVPGATSAAAAPAGADPRHTPSPEHPLRVHVVMFDGAEEQDFIGPYEVFSLAGGLSGGAVQTRYVHVDGPRTVTAAFGTRVVVEHGWSPRSADVVVVPGGGFRRPDGPGIWSEINRGVLPRALADARRRGLIISSLCTGAIVLAAAGLTGGRPCTTHNGAKAELAARGGVVKNARVVDDGDLVTAAGITSGLELALHLVRRRVGADLAVRAEEVLEYQARGTVWTP
ncbi:MULTISPECIES: DJ-1/PfpI family protein [unclassified Solwaraspora]|uniref:DJ-1/PfpI family protein n=1 Tax=unclassified Solwaraspora TaxID=2627926 RepID=UPI00259BD336|nr:DJ-1/PfpI family protein [Solwaraspora sp. WMMA2056]WJK38533.1 DJ-1/PfpI family protein [Solwaraspora sp. WMMA2056]